MTIRRFFYEQEVLCREQNLIVEKEVPWWEESSIMAKDEVLVGKDCSIIMRRKLY